MEDLVTQLATLLGTDAHTVGMVLAGLLDIARQGLGPDGAELIARIPGATDLLAANLMGTGGIAGLLGGPDPNALGQLVQDSGLDPGQVATIADMLLTYVEKTVGTQAANQLFSALPGLGELG